MSKPLPQWFCYGRDCRFSGKRMLENFPAYIQPREELNSSIFEELQEQIFKKDTLLSKYETVRITT